MAVALEDFTEKSYFCYLFVIGLWKLISRARKRTVRVLIKAKCVREFTYKLRKAVDISNCSARGKWTFQIVSTVRRTQYLFILLISPLVALMRDHGALRLKKQSIAAAYEGPRRLQRFWRALKMGTQCLRVSGVNAFSGEVEKNAFYWHVQAGSYRDSCRRCSLYFALVQYTLPVISDVVLNLYNPKAL